MANYPVIERDAHLEEGEPESLEDLTKALVPQLGFTHTYEMYDEIPEDWHQHWGLTPIEIERFSYWQVTFSFDGRSARYYLATRPEFDKQRVPLPTKEPEALDCLRTLIELPRENLGQYATWQAYNEACGDGTAEGARQDSYRFVHWKEVDRQFRALVGEDLYQRFRKSEDR